MVGLVNFLLDLQCISTEAQRDRTNFFRTRQKNAKEDEKTGFKPHVIQCLFGVKLSSPPGRIPLHKSIMFLIDCKIAIISLYVRTHLLAVSNITIFGELAHTT